MTYRELLELYKQGKLDEETRKQVENAIEKQDAISDYLFDQTEIQSLSPEVPEEQEKNEIMLKTIQKTVRRTMARMGLIVGAAVLAVVAVSAMVLPGLVSKFYYEPDTIVRRNPENKDITTNRMSLDLTVWSELYLPGAYRDLVNIENEGWGKYTVSIPQNITTTGHFKTVNGRLVRNKLTLYETDTLKPPTGNAFLMPDSVKGGPIFLDGESGENIGPWGGRNEYREHLDKLHEDEWYIGYVSFDEIWDYPAFYEWYQQQELGAANAWCGVYTEDEEGWMLGENIGFIFQAAGFCRDFEMQEYPYLSVLGVEHTPEPADPQQMQQHFISLLSYQMDHPKFAELMAPGQTQQKQMLQKMIDAVKRDGLRVYGFAITAQKETLEKLADDPNVGYIYAVPAE